MGEVYEKCAVVGVFDPHQATEFAAQGIRELDHRGPHSTGLGGITPRGDFDVFRTPGRASKVLTDERVATVAAKRMTAVLAHGRYATFGSPDDIHPFETQEILCAENGSASDTRELEADLKKRGYSTAGVNDTQMKTLDISDRMRHGADMVEAIHDAYSTYIGGYSIVVVGRTPDGGPMLAAFRDRCGIRPLFWGRTPNGGVMFASETTGLDAAGATLGGEVEPGSLMTVSHSGMHHYQLAPPDPHFDPIELIYFSNKDSLFKGVRIGDIRKALGRQAAIEYRDFENSDMIVGVPNSAKPFAEGYAKELGIEYCQKALSKLSTERTFLGKTKEEQEALRNAAYNLVAFLVSGRRLTFFDDSLFRNNTAPHLTRLARAAGAASVNVVIGSPPIRNPNFYGINTPRQEELVASQKSMEGIREDIGCRGLGYLSLEGMLKVFYEMTGEPGDHFDLSCFNGDYSHTSIGDRQIPTPKYTGNSAWSNAIL